MKNNKVKEYIGYRYESYKGHWIYRVIQLRKDLKAYDQLGRVAHWNNIKFKDTILKPFRSKSYEHAKVLLKGKFVK